VGEAKRRKLNGDAPRAPGVIVKRGQVRVVPNIKLQNVDADGITMLMLGEREPELAAALMPADARTLAMALLQHAEAIEHPKTAVGHPLIVLPGGGGLHA